jgi:myo-inositol-1(or 4)-monophosphatase
VSAKEYKSISAASAVTEIDWLVEQKLKASLAKIMPMIPFVGEEFGGDRDSGTFWLSDPIDGTGHFIRGIPFSTTMLALIDKGEVIFSVIYDFLNDDIYHAELGKGAYKNGEKISVSDRTLQQAYMFYEFKPTTAGKEVFDYLNTKSTILQTLSSGFQFILVACGKADSFIVYDGYGQDYDFAAGSLLVKEAGGIVRNFKSDTYDYKNLSFIASNKTIYEELVGSDNSIEKLM